MTLISQACLCNKRYRFIFEGNLYTITFPNGSLCKTIESHNNMYIIFNHIMSSVQKSITLYDLHQKLRHLSYMYIKWLIKNHPNTINYKIIEEEEPYNICTKANIK